ncbi:Amino acid transporter [Nocardioides alpinus]|uniref:APC family permease n=1 Tax=Nocardioides alpinus TaxID=748909 RepID=A0A1I0ZED2_9ACTN|nr:APC family permease [Nocardioides alpinus]PKH40657.1 APC family permease [Nocardioides alpinus]SFB23742.1 Amino acid transporter [Nocardioides alpinus]
MSASDGPRPSLRFRDRSVFDGVARQEVGSVDLAAHSVAVLVPSLTALGTGLAFPAMIGPGFWLSTLLGFGVVFLLASTFGEFSTRFRSAGTLYTFVAKGLGPAPALVVAGCLVVGYAAMIGFGLTDAAGRADAALDASGLGGAGPWRIGALFLVGVIMCLYAMTRGIHWSTRAALVAEAASFVILGAVLVVWTLRYGLPSTGAFSLQGASPGRILLGAATIVTLTLAFESSASLGLETRRPFREVPLALKSSLALAAVLFVIANVVATARPADAPSIWTWRWLSPGADRSVSDALVLVVLAWSLVALAMCVWSALARLLFSMSREGILPAALGRVDTRGIPVVATLAVLPLVVTPPVFAMLAGVGLDGFSWQLKLSASVVLCVAYASAAASLPLFLRSIDEVTHGPVLAAVIGGIGAAAVAANELVRELRDGNPLGLALLAVAFAVGLGMWVQTGRGSTPADRYVGMHDEALAGAVILAPATPGDGHVD